MDIQQAKRHFETYLFDTITGKDSNGLFGKLVEYVVRYQIELRFSKHTGKELEKRLHGLQQRAYGIQGCIYDMMPDGYNCTIFCHAFNQCFVCPIEELEKYIEEMKQRLKVEFDGSHPVFFSRK